MGGGSSGSALDPAVANLFNVRAARESQAWGGVGQGAIQGYQQGSPYTSQLLNYGDARRAQDRASRLAGFQRQMVMAGVDPNSPAALQARQQFDRNEGRSFDANQNAVYGQDLAYRLASGRLALGGQADPIAAATAYANLTS